MKNKKHIKFEDFLHKKLQNSEFALAYLNEALEDEDQRVFLLALKDVIDARKESLVDLAEEAHLNRQNLYRILSNKGNPKLKSLKSLCNAAGFELNLTLKK